MPPCFHTAMLARQRGSIDVWMRDAASALYYSGATPEEIYDPGSAVGPSGPIIGKVAGNVLSPVETPDYAQVLTGLAGDPLGAGFTAGTTDSFDAANATVHDAIPPQAILLSFNLTTSPTANQIMGKRGGVGNYGWEAYITATRLYNLVAGTTGATNQVYVPYVAADEIGVAHWAFLWWSQALNNVGILSSIGTATAPVALAPIGAITNTMQFSLGSNRISSAGAIVGPTLIWSGAQAEIAIAARSTWLPAWALATGAF